MKATHQTLKDGITWVKSGGDTPHLYPARVVGTEEKPNIYLDYRHAGVFGREAQKRPQVDTLWFESGSSTLGVFVVPPDGWPDMDPFQNGIRLPIGVTLIAGSDRSGLQDTNCLNSLSVQSEVVGRSEAIVNMATLRDEFKAGVVSLRIPKKTSSGEWSNDRSWAFGNDVSSNGMWTKMPFDATGEWCDVANHLRAMARAYTAFLTLVKGKPLDESLQVELNGDGVQPVKAIVPVKSLSDGFPGRLPNCPGLFDNNAGVECLRLWMQAFLNTGPDGDSGVKLDLLRQWFELGDQPPFALMEGLGCHLAADMKKPTFDQCLTTLTRALGLQRAINPHKDALRTARNGQQHQGRTTSWVGRFRHFGIPHLAELLLVFGFLHVGMGDAMPAQWRNAWMERIEGVSAKIKKASGEGD